MTEHIVSHFAGADGVASQELLVGQSVGDQDVDQGQHHRRVGAGHDADPLRTHVGEGVVALGRERHDAGGRADAAGVPGADMPVVPAWDDPGVGAAQPAEGDQQLRVLGDVGPRHRTGAQGEVALLADDVGLHHHARATAVVVDRAGIAADPVQETMELALGVVEAAGTGPAVGAAEDRLVAERGAHAVQLVSEQVKGGGPVNLDVLVVGAATVIVGAGAVLEPPPAQGRAGDACPGMLRVGDVGDRRGRIGVVGVRPGPGDMAVVVDVDQVGAPVGARLHLMRHDTHVPTETNRL